MKYELVAGLETHVELSTRTKIFCGCTTAFGGEPNTHCCPICIGLPGTLPKLNRQVVNYAVLAGLATHCEITETARMDRKNYVYPDLAKAYQISQFDRPLCKHGWVELDNGRKIRLTRIHIEEDAGKLVHERGDTYVDYNRAGVPLIEIVTEPDFRSVSEVREYVEKLQILMKYIGVSDAKMQEGSLRCDVNISVRPVGSQVLGTRTEIKNMNSFTFISRAMEYEMERQIDLLESGEPVVQETLRYNPDTGETESMRGKEDAQDYRYFREPDLVAIRVSPEEVENLRRTLPELPDTKYTRYTGELGLPTEDARLLTKYRRAAEFFDEAVTGLSSPKTAANLILGPIFRRLETDSAKEAFQLPFEAAEFRKLLVLLDQGKLRMSLAKAVLEKMLDTGEPVSKLVSAEDLSGVDDGALKAACEAAVTANPGAAADYRGGKEKALKALIGAVMKATKGRADAAKAEEMLIALLKQGS